MKVAPSLTLCIGIGALLNLIQMESIRAAIEFPIALESSIKKISKEDLAEKEQFGFMFKNVLCLAAIERFGNLALYFSGISACYDNLQEAFRAGTNYTGFVTRFINPNSVHNAFDEGWALPVVFENIFREWRGKRIAIRHGRMQDGALECVFEIEVFDDWIKMGALSVHDGLRVELGRICRFLGNPDLLFSGLIQFL
jgi:hypothetical protein